MKRAPVDRVAITCVADVRLRGVCSILLRHSGYRIVEAGTLAEALGLIESTAASVIVTGELADPDDRLTSFARERGIESIRLGPHIKIEALLDLFEAVQD